MEINTAVKRTGISAELDERNCMLHADCASRISDYLKQRAI